VVGVRVGANEVALQRQVKHAGDWWNPAARVWEMPYNRSIALGLKDRLGSGVLLIVLKSDRYTRSDVKNPLIEQ
jgi:hypothetical protein